MSMLNGKAIKDIFDSDYVKERKRLLQLIKELKSLGAGEDLGIPQIAIIGNQSAGKSSLIEGITGITVPRSERTCTRSPMECRLRSDDTILWQCQISLRRVSSDGDNAFTSSSLSAEEEPFGPIITKKSELEIALRRAQLAILNPSRPASDFLTFDIKKLAPENSQHKFSDSVICLDIVGQKTPDLAFIDLPGIIHYGEQCDINAVLNMVEYHIKPESTVILLAISMEVDIETQAAVQLARKIDPNGERTLGVLTKPDRAPADGEAIWLQILEGKEHPLRHGYFMTMRPSQKELNKNISFTSARQNEDKFFDTKRPWCSAAHLRERMGTVNLIRELSKLLSDLIRKSLPRIRETAKTKLDETERDLAALPSPPSPDPLVDLHRMINKYNKDVCALVEGANEAEQLWQEARLAFAVFRDNIRQTAPMFVPFTEEESASYPVGLVLDTACSTYRLGTVQDPNIDMLSMNLDSVREHIESRLTRELPCNIPYKAKVWLIRACQKSWKEHCDECFEAVHAATRKLLGDLARSQFTRYPELDRCVSLVTEQLVEKYRLKTCERIAWAIGLEKMPYNNHADSDFNTYRDRYLMQYRAARPHREIPATYNGLAYGASANGSSYESSIEQIYHQEFEVMAQVATYFHISFKRIIDDIPRLIDFDFFLQVANDMHEALLTGLHLTDDNARQKAQCYLAEDRTTASRRQELQRKSAMLNSVLDKVKKFDMTPQQ